MNSMIHLSQGRNGLDPFYNLDVVAATIHEQQITALQASKQRAGLMNLYQQHAASAMAAALTMNAGL